MQAIWTIGLILLLSTQLLACSDREGLDAYERGDYIKALEIWRPLAEQGHSHQQYLLGFMYKRGNGVPQDHEEAVKWFRKAAEQEHPIAQNNLGLAYTKGLGVPTDEKEAVKWFRKSAEQGFSEAQYSRSFNWTAGFCSSDLT